MRLLVAEDNPIIAQNIAEYLRCDGFQVTVVLDGEAAFEVIAKELFDFLVLDRMMPKIDGISLVRLLQAKWINIPFLFLTALGKSVDRIEGLSLGADDYLVKPFDLQELKLRIENILRRSWTQTVLKSSENIVWDVRIDTAAHRVFRWDTEVFLSPKEYSLLVLLVTNRWVIMTRDRIFEEIWGDYGSDFSFESDTINVHIAYLRKKLGPTLIRTIKLVWYVIDA